MRHWEAYGLVRKVATLLSGVLGINDATIGLARDFPAPGSAMLGPEDGMSGYAIAGRVLVAACVACEGSGVIQPGWAVPSWARGQSVDGSHPANQTRLCRWMPMQAMLNVLRRAVLLHDSPGGREQFAPVP